MQELDEWDLVVIGGGSAGLTASKTASGFGARVLLIERDRLGGECLWTGCVPSKALIAAAHAAHSATHSARLGTTAHEVAVDFPTVMASVQSAMEAIAPTDSRASLEAESVTVMQGGAHFTSSRTLGVDGAEVRFRQAVIATGSAPAQLPLEGIDTVDVLTSDNFWELEELPGRLLIIGGGSIGCELGQAMARLGSAVSIVQRAERILPKEEQRASRVVHDALIRDGASIHAGRTGVKVISSDGLSGQLFLDDGTLIEFDRMVVAIGRQSRNDDLHLHKAGVDTDSKGFVSVDQLLRTSNDRIWAAGDATPLPKFTHIAGVNGSIAATNAILGLRRSIDGHLVPRVTFTAPEVAAVGLQAGDADSGRHRVVTWEHNHLDRAVTDSHTHGFTQMVVDRKGRILGGTIVGPRAGETVGELTLAVKQGLTTTALAGTTHPYPTYNDALWNSTVADVRHRLGRGLPAVAIRFLVKLRSVMLKRL